MGGVGVGANQHDAQSTSASFFANAPSAYTNATQSSFPNHVASSSFTDVTSSTYASPHANDTLRGSTASVGKQAWGTSSSNAQTIPNNAETHHECEHDITADITGTGGTGVDMATLLEDDLEEGNFSWGREEDMEIAEIGYLRPREFLVEVDLASEKLFVLNTSIGKRLMGRMFWIIFACATTFLIVIFPLFFHEEGRNSEKRISDDVFCLHREDGTGAVHLTHLLLKFLANGVAIFSLAHRASREVLRMTSFSFDGIVIYLSYFRAWIIACVHEFYCYGVEDRPILIVAKLMHFLYYFELAFVTGNVDSLVMWDRKTKLGMWVLIIGLTLFVGCLPLLKKDEWNHDSDGYFWFTSMSWAQHWVSSFFIAAIFLVKGFVTQAYFGRQFAYVNCPMELVVMARTD